MTPHDALFKGIFSTPEVAAAELSLLPKALADAIDWSSLQLVPGSFVDERLEKRETDLLFAGHRSDPVLTPTHASEKQRAKR